MSLPVMLQPSFGRALVVGGGPVAARKVQAVRAAGFPVTVVAVEVCPAIDAADEGIVIIERRFIANDLHDHALVFVCTNDRAVNQRVGKLATSARIPVLVADAPEESTFHLPAVHRDGDLTVAVSTDGASPTLARALRDRVAEGLGEGWASQVEQARTTRNAKKAAAAISEEPV